MLTILGDALNVAIRRRATPLPEHRWADRYTPGHRRTDTHAAKTAPTLRDLPR
ncbi:hypothetical protein [Flavimaricola marinus]|uniref:Uncharacterized protein n=1 Tax=Flavimaricola marinus TaxID=1819565 RepID=A0A238LE62_9RHOB|nr:hypothetical protein [Flavimaricola marinus]SMY07220.1 hypothetical protein LOM8899_01352 [Flavimaricola marinus]